MGDFGFVVAIEGFGALGFDFGVGFGGAVGVDRFLREVVGPSAGGDEGCPAVAVVWLVVLWYAMMCYAVL